MNKQKIFIFLVIIIFISCSTEKNSKLSTKNIENKPDILLVKKDNIEKREVEPILSKKKEYVYAYSDSVKVHLIPNDSSKVVGYLNFYESLIRLEWFSNRNNIDQSGNGYASSWFAVSYLGDTAWVSRYEDISTELSIDTIKDLVFMNYYNFCDFGNVGCYFESKIYNIANDRILFKGYSSFIEPYLINDSIVLYNQGGFYHLEAKVCLYNLNQEKLIFSTSGFQEKKSNVENAIYFIRKKEWDLPVQLIKYGYLDNDETVLYEETTDSTYYCYRHWDGGSCDEFNLEIADTIEYIIFKIHSVKEEVEIDKTYEIKVDNFGNCHYRNIK